jgi:nucleotidyltransferase/DNA polymerase involved in DNA repair
MSEEPGFIVKFYDKKYEKMNILELVDAPVEAISGISKGDAEKLKKAFNIKTVLDLASHKYIKYARALTNFTDISDDLLDKEFEAKEITTLAERPVHAIQGVSKGDAVLLKEAFNIKTIRDLATNKYVAVAETTVSLAALVVLLVDTML